MRAFLQHIKELMIIQRLPIEDWQKRSAHYHGPEEYEYIDSEWVPFQLGDLWSEEEHVTTFFKTRTKLPANWAGKKVYLYCRTGGEACIHLNGQIYHGLDENHHDAPINSNHWAGQEMEILIEAALHRINKIYVPDPDYVHRLSVAEFRMIDEGAEEFYYNLLALIELVELLEEQPQSQPIGDPQPIRQIVEDLHAQFEELGVADAVEIDFTELNQAYLAAVQALGKDESYQMACFGHAHIDVAWLWQFKETIRKSGRTFSTAIRLMEEYPEFQFIQSQPQLYQYIKDYYPSLYAEIKEKIKSGQWQPEGGMWVEADTNLISGESLVRQFLYGKAFFREEFGIESKILWLPDVFGYVGSLPQIMQKSEIDYFMTSKISWNDTNDFPYSIFHWEGIDGSRVLTHIPRVILPFTYNGEVYADKVYKVKANYEEQKEPNLFEYKFGDSSNYFKQDRVIPDDQLMFIYGYGDGGGGVTREFIEKIKRFDQLPFLPHMKYSQPLEYFQGLAEEMIEEGTDYPTWRGELYFEYHRGVYTSQAKTKLNNRQAETRIRQAEMLCTLAGIDAQEKIRRIWEKIATNQFHDIIPGTSITEVYQDVDQIYREIDEEIQELIAIGMARLVRNVELPQSSDGSAVAQVVEVGNATEDADQSAFISQENSTYYTVWNGLSYTRGSYVTIPERQELAGKQVVAIDVETGAKLETFSSRWNGRSELQIWVPEIPALGYRMIQVELSTDLATAVLTNEQEPIDTGQEYFVSSEIPKHAQVNQPTNLQYAQQLTVDNSFFKLTFAQGHLISVYDKRREFELIAESSIANQFQFFVDKPPRYQAWEQVAEFEEMRVREEMELLDWRYEDQGRLQVVSINKKFRDSTFQQKIILNDQIDRIDFQTQVDWREREVMVKTAFPVQINSELARYEIAYGNLTRSTTNNTDYEKAQFEVPAHRWADLSQPGLGVSLINDSKYGYDIKGQEIRLTLLKGPNYPDPTADYGEHQFTYSLYAHDGVYYQSDLLKHAETLNTPPLVAEYGKEKYEGLDQIGADLALQGQMAYQSGSQASHAFCRVTRGKSRLEVLKVAEDGDGWILRLYEPYGAREKVSVQLGLNQRIASARVVNLLERPIEEGIQWSADQVSFKMEPYEIKTIRIKLTKLHI